MTLKDLETILGKKLDIQYYHDIRRFSVTMPHMVFTTDEGAPEVVKTLGVSVEAACRAFGKAIRGRRACMNGENFWITIPDSITF